MENGRQQNYWPGFVDALSNLVLTLVFVMTIFILALFYLSSKVTQGKMDNLCPETQAELVKAKKDLDESHSALQAALMEARQAKEQVQALQKESSRNNVAQKPDSLLDRPVDINVKKGKLLQKSRTSTETSGNGSVITIRFPSSIVDLDEGAKEVLDKVLAPFLAEKQPMKISLNAVPGPETYSEGRRLSFFRAVAVRNYLIGKGISKANIESMVAERGNLDPNDSDGRIVIQLQRAAR